MYKATMSIGRFEDIRRLLRFDDKRTRASRLETDHMTAFRYIWDLFLVNCRQKFIPSDCVTVDEQLVPFRGRTKFLQYMPSKPAKYGIKIFWVCDARTPYAIDGIVYTGRQPGEEVQKNLGENTVREVDIFTFLKSRNIPDNIVNQLKDDKIDINVINVMTDEELGKYIERYGDRLALRAFCWQRTGTNETTVKSGERTTVKSSLMEKIRDRLQGKGEKADPDVGPGVGNKHASKDTRRVEIGWLNFEKGKYYQVRTRHGGGTRHMSVQKTMTVEELLDIGKALFFPNGKSAKGPLKDFKFDVRDFSHCPVPLENTMQQLYDQTKLRMLRIYTCSKEKDKEVSPKDATIMLSDSDTSSDCEPTDHRPIKTSRKQRQSVSNQPRRYHPSRIGTDHPVHHIERSSDSDPAPNDSVQEKNEEDSRHASQEDCLFPASNQDADELFAGESDSALALAIHASMEDFEVQVGPISGYYGDDQDDTLPWNPHHLNSLQHSTLNDDAASPRGSEKEVHYVKFRRCEGEDERVPRLRPDYSEKEWQAVGVSSVDEELLMMSFLRYLSVTERESVEKVLEGNLEEIDEEDLLDLFSRMGSHCLPSKDKIRAAIVVMAHKALLQEPKFIIDCFHSSIHNAVPSY
ncbi:PiggyBac transposable element-derived protein 4 [Dissostichus eleginoides]|uniref:PiggyBac transposable element-derived protein 4 n=1 Tax=Dissostichus eleginoides TaxID=100907 RepID=A0AAD9EZ58_DISEL|nr:PiggyBac transposable element-derived protein 4 [Dissostichus eleginoides]